MILQSSLRQWDIDESYIRSLARAEEIAREKEIAVQTALRRHPITDYVLQSPVESPHEFLETHPANSDYDNRGCGRYIEWSLPGADTSDRNGCGFRTSSVVSCVNDRSHYLKAVRLHCWTLTCPDCFNDTCMKRGAQAEKRILAYADLVQRQGGRAPRLSHWVVSPPQEWAVKCMIDPERMPTLKRWLESLLIAHGMLGGYAVFHPWRLSDSHEWVVGPHFHIIGYGWLDNRAIVHRYPGTVVKQVHPGERIRSVRQTVAYLLTHTGIGFFERDPEDVDLDLDFLNRMIPGVSQGRTESDYTEQDYVDQASGKGRMVGDISGFDWQDPVLDRFVGRLDANIWFGCLSQRNIRVFDVYKVRNIRTCTECGSALHMYNSLEDPRGEPAEYVRQSPIFVFATHFSAMREIWLRYKDQLALEGMDVMDFAVRYPQFSCAETMGLEEYDNTGQLRRSRDAGRHIRYVPSIAGTGYDPVVMDDRELVAWESFGLVLPSVERSAPVVSGSPVELR